MTTTTNTTTGPATDSERTDFDVVVVGAGFAGLYLLHRLRGMGLNATVLEVADDVGGTWYWNRYPGARCDIESLDYSYSFDTDLEQEWEWSEKYATQPEILRYLNHVADRHDLRRDICFGTNVSRAQWHEETSTWQITTDRGVTNPGNVIECRWFVMATGCLSMPKVVDIEGVHRFDGLTYSTSRWPHDGVDFAGMRVGLIGAGSSAIQSIPEIAKQADELTVFQRTPNFSIPAGNRPLRRREVDDVKRRYSEYREEARWSRGGVPKPVPVDSARSLDAEERTARLEAAWEEGTLIGFLTTFTDSAINQESNDLVAEFVRGKIREAVDDPEVAELLCPTSYPIGTKRLCLDSDYFAAYNLAHVTLVDLRAEPIKAITEHGINTAEGSFEFDALVFATGFDAMTGAIVAVDIAGRGGVALADKWRHGPTTYLGLTVPEFPNFFMVTGPQSPSVISNMAVSIEQHVEWITDCIGDMREQGFDTIEATATAQAGWQQHNQDCADITLYPKAHSWYMGANIAGKPRVILPYLGGVGTYREICNEVAENGYVGFSLSGPERRQSSDAIVRRLQPDVSILLTMMSELGLPPIESMTASDARAFVVATAELRPSGPEVGEIIDGTYDGAAGELSYRLYRPPTSGPHHVAVYFHGGGWVLGGADADDPLCRDLCINSDLIIVSCDYRHAPEARFPAAAHDGFAAVQWVHANVELLGAAPGAVAVCGWSAGGNVAAVACQLARDSGGPEISGQVLIAPVTDCDWSRASYGENADGYVLTRPLMEWFWDHYCDVGDRTHPMASPLLADDLSSLPPALVVTAEFDPLRDEGNAYAAALEAAGTPTRLMQLRGQIHTSVTGVDMIISADSARLDIAQTLTGFSSGSVEP